MVVFRPPFSAISNYKYELEFICEVCRLYITTRMSILSSYIEIYVYSELYTRT